ncbi:MAG: uL15 family ribosomal protein, partial [Spirochaetales bacterium]|nr:uL15 family ribosomal protein [Spirochaetales bacterium]
LNVSKLETSFEAGGTVTPKTLVAAGAIATMRKRAPKVKILGAGELTKKLTISGCEVSTSAKEKIEKAGGTVIGIKEGNNG